MKQDKRKQGSYILVLAPNIGNADDIWEFKPFGDKTLNVIFDDVSKLIANACKGTSYGPNFEFYVPFNYFVHSQNANDLDREKRQVIAEDVHKALIDCLILDKTNFPILANNASTIIKWFSSSFSKYKKLLYIKNENAEKYSDELEDFVVTNFPVQSNELLIALLAWDSFGPEIQALMDYYPKKR